MNSAPVRFILTAFNAAAVLYQGTAQTVPSGSSAPRILSAKHVGRIRIHGQEEGRVRLAAEDKGVDLKRIFRHRFTAKADGHRFALRSCARHRPSRNRLAGIRRQILAAIADQKRRRKKKESMR